jgi:hypothetical protein
MQRRGALALLIGALQLGMVFAASAQATPQELRGTATSVVDGRVLYTELHRWQGDRHRAEYHAPDGTLLVVNELDYSPGRAQPAFVQTTLATGEQHGARWQGETLTLFYGDQTSKVDYREPLVISSGFNNFVLGHWDELLRGEQRVVDFAVPEHLRIVRLKIGRIAPDQTTIGDTQPEWTFFRVQAANRVIAWFVPPVDLAYDAERHLRVYRGTSNVEIDGETPAVEIRY